MSVLQLTLAGSETLTVARFAVQEAISQPFAVSIWGHSPDPSFSLEAILDRPASFEIVSGQAFTLGLGRRTWHGIVVAADLVHALQPAIGQRGLSTYHVRLAPQIYRLHSRRSHRIFQHASIPEIVDALLAEWSIARTWKIDRMKYPRLEFKVQYGETDFQFMSRLLEQAGLSYAFPDDSGGILTFGDAFEHNPVRPGLPIRYVDEPGQSAEQEFVTRVRVEREVRPGAIVLSDYAFRNPDFALRVEAEPRPGVKHRNEQFVHRQGVMLAETGKGGDSPVADDRGIARHDERYGRAQAERFLLGMRGGARTISFETNVFDLEPGMVFQMDGHPHREGSAGRTLLVTETVFEGTAQGEWCLAANAVGADQPYRPAQRTLKPIIHGFQSATVVGPKASEIHTDEFGRVRVRFPWDREGRRDNDCTCWMRVNEGWGGMGYGFVVLPRVGHEVLVAFAEGDPDAPFVVGRTYNAVQQVPYKLPEHKTRSTWKSDSSLGSSGFNEVMLEDLAGHELVWQQAERDRRRLVKNDETGTIGKNREKFVKRNEFEHTDGYRKRWVGKDADFVTAKKKRERVEADEGVVVRGRASECIDGNASLLVVGERHELIEGSNALRAGESVHYAVGEVYVGEAGEAVTLQGPGGFLRLDAEGVTIVGTVVKINVTGKPGKGRGAKVEEPEESVLEALAAVCTPRGDQT